MAAAPHRHHLQGRTLRRWRHLWGPARPPLPCAGGTPRGGCTPPRGSGGNRREQTAAARAVQLWDRAFAVGRATCGSGCMHTRTKGHCCRHWGVRGTYKCVGAVVNVIPGWTPLAHLRPKALYLLGATLTTQDSPAARQRPRLCTAWSVPGAATPAGPKGRHGGDNALQRREAAYGTKTALDVQLKVLHFALECGKPWSDRIPAAQAAR